MKTFLTLTILLAASTAFAGEATFYWIAPEIPPDHYEIHYGQAHDALDNTETVPGNVVQWTIKGLTAGDTVFAQIVKFNATGEASKPSAGTWGRWIGMRRRKAFTFRYQITINQFATFKF